MTFANLLFVKHDVTICAETTAMMAGKFLYAIHPTRRINLDN